MLKVLGPGIHRIHAHDRVPMQRADGKLRIIYGIECRPETHSAKAGFRAKFERAEAKFHFPAYRAAQRANLKIWHRQPLVRYLIIPPAFHSSGMKPWVVHRHVAAPEIATRRPISPDVMRLAREVRNAIGSFRL